jgi:hypothetical protein
LKGKKKVPHLPPHPRSLILGMFFFNWKILKVKWFWKFSISKSEGEKILKIARFLCLTKIIEGLLKFCNSYTIYSHIWLHLPRDDAKKMLGK